MKVLVGDTPGSIFLPAANRADQSSCRAAADSLSAVLRPCAPWWSKPSVLRPGASVRGGRRDIAAPELNLSDKTGPSPRIADPGRHSGKSQMGRLCYKSRFCTCDQRILRAGRGWCKVRGLIADVKLMTTSRMRLRSYRSMIQQFRIFAKNSWPGFRLCNKIGGRRHMRLQQNSRYSMTSSAIAICSAARSGQLPSLS